MISQRNRGQFIRSTAIARKINRKITLVFLYFPRIEKNISQLFCTSDKQKFNHMISQRNHWQFIRSPPIVRKIIALVFHYFARIEKNASQLFCKGDIEYINQAINIYENYDKKIPLEWPICTSTDILRT